MERAGTIRRDDLHRQTERAAHGAQFASVGAGGGDDPTVLVVGEGGGEAQRVGAGQEVAAPVVGEPGGVAERVGDGQETAAGAEEAAGRVSLGGVGQGDLDVAGLAALRYDAVVVVVDEGGGTAFAPWTRRGTARSGSRHVVSVAVPQPRSRMTAPSSPATPVDLRVHPVDTVLERVESSLHVRFDLDTLVRKRRTVGARTDRGTWVRIERRPYDKIEGQGWNGAECAASLDGVDKPAWFGGVVWRDAAEAAMWRADETELLPGTPVTPETAVALPDEWWGALNASLNVLAAHHTTRVATPDTVAITQAGVTESVRAVFPSVHDTTIRNWVPAHADLTWANVTAPRFCLFDWEDWGMAPLGLDTAWLWGNSLAIPDLAARVRRERHRDLESRDGKLMALFFCTTILGPYVDPDDSRRELAQRETERLVAELRAG